MNYEPELVEEPAWQQRPDEGAAAKDRDVLAQLPVQFGYFLRDVAFNQGRVTLP